MQEAAPDRSSATLWTRCSPPPPSSFRCEGRLAPRAQDGAAR